MAPTTTIILGSGLGGLACANALRRAMPSPHRIVVVEKSPTVIVGASKTWVMLGLRTIEQVSRRVDSLLLPGIELVTAEVNRIDPNAGEVYTDEVRLQGDQLVIALGANLDMGAVPGMQRGASTFYALQAAAELCETLRSFEQGEIVMLIPRTPFKCPPAPYEAAILLREQFVQRGLGQQVRISIHTVEGAPMTTAGPSMGQFIRETLAERGIALHVKHPTKSIDPDQRQVHFEDGSNVPYDLLIAVPPHRPPRAVRECPVAGPGGWIPVDPTTLLVKGTARPCYAIGDVASVALPGRFLVDVPLFLPKAGVFAEAQGLAVAADIAERVLGLADEDSPRFDGRGACYVEMGGGVAVRGDGEFFATPHPRVQATTATAAHLREKVEWVEGWMRKQP